MAISVDGPVPVAELGMTLVHEHLHMDAGPLLEIHGYEPSSDRPFDLEAAAEARWDPGSHAHNYRFTEVELIATEVEHFRAAGGATIVDQTPPALGRDPAALQRIAARAGVNVIMGTGHYLGPTHEPWVAETSIEELAGHLARECRDGDPATGVRPGIIGEIGTSDPVLPAEERVLRAAARAAIESGLAVSVHLHPWARTGRHVLELLLGEGLDPERIVLGHLNTAWDDERYLQGLADGGARLAFDLFGFDHSLLGVGRWPPADRDAAATVASLVARGHTKQLLLSHDIGVRTRLRAFGSWGYAHLPRHVVPLLRELGVSASDIDTMLVSNPASLLEVDGG